MGKPNPLNYDCTKDGCYLLQRKPRLEDLASQLRGQCSFTDIDGMTECNSNFLMVEWKTLARGDRPRNGHRPNRRPEDNGTIPFGQHLAYSRAAQSGRFITMCLAGDPTTVPMTVTHWGWYIGCWKDNFTGWSRTDLTEVDTAIKEWRDWADDHCGRYEQIALSKVRRFAQRLLAEEAKHTEFWSGFYGSMILDGRLGQE